MDRRGQFLVAIFFALLAVAFTGGERQGIGFSKECIDAIDNDADGSIDDADYDCRSYPYADGFGETFTPIGADYQGEYYSVSYFDWEYQYGIHAGDDAGHFCPQYPTLVNDYQNIENYSGGKDRAYTDYIGWHAINCP